MIQHSTFTDGGFVLHKVLRESHSQIAARLLGSRGEVLAMKFICYDNGGATADRYTVIPLGAGWHPVKVRGHIVREIPA